MAFLQSFNLPAAILCFVAIIFWAFALLPEYLTALIFLLGVICFGVASPEIALSGFYSPALWLVFSGLVLGRAIHVTGLGDRISKTFIAWAPRSQSGNILAIAFAGFVLSFFMPSSMGRVAMIVPITILIAAQLKVPPHSQSRDILITVAALGAYLPSAAILPANIPNLILASGAASLYGISFSYMDYLVATFPTIGIGKFMIIVAAGLLLSSSSAKRGQEPSPSVAINAQERRLIVILGIAVGLWITDDIHGINPAWVGLGAAIFCLLPRIGALNEQDFNHKLSWSAFIHAAGIIGLGAVVASSGIGDSVGRVLSEFAPFSSGNSFWNFMILTVLMTLICVITTTPGLPAVATPLAASLADASGLPLRAVLLIQVLAFSTIVLPFQGAPLVFAFHTAGVSLRTAMKVLGLVTLGSIVIIAPLTYLWWRALGEIP